MTFMVKRNYLPLRFLICKWSVAKPHVTNSITSNSTVLWVECSCKGLRRVWKGLKTFIREQTENILGIAGNLR